MLNATYWLSGRDPETENWCFKASLPHRPFQSNPWLGRKTGRKLFEVKTHMATGLQKDYEPSELSTIGPGLLILRVSTAQFREQCVQTGLPGE